jgi:hypothetical protein
LIPSTITPALHTTLTAQEEQATTANPLEGGDKGRSKVGPWRQFVFDPAALIPPDQPVFEGLLSKGDLAIWLGREKHRKSSVLLQFAICAALGRPFLHFLFCSSQSSKVVMLDYESKSQTLKQRYEAIVAAMGLAEAEKETLRAQLRIVEIRKAFRSGWNFVRFPVKPDGANSKELCEAAEEWQSFLQETTADIYIIDPMRCMHAQAENDSAIEALLTRIHKTFGNATVVISHHLRKRDRGVAQKLMDDMRVWADEARGSSAITAHADVIVCQERIVENGMEKLHWGAYLRDSVDIEPMVLRESAPQNFLWEVAPDIPDELAMCLDPLRAEGRAFQSRTDAARVLMNTPNTGRSTAFSRIKELLNRGLLVEVNGTLIVKETVDEPGNAQ